MKRKYFGTDGIRGRVGKAPMTVDFILKLGWAAGKVLGKSDRGTGGYRQRYAHFRIHV